jgi:ribosomal subunit interface protein
VEKLSRFDSKIISITIHLISEKAHRGQEHDYSCELEIDLPGKNLSIIDTERELEKAVDKVVERAKRLIIKSKEKRVSKKHREGIKNKKRV